MTIRSVSEDAQQILLASELIRLGARLQLLESETSLSRERLLKLYKELRGVSPPRVCCRFQQTGLSAGNRISMPPYFWVFIGI